MILAMVVHLIILAVESFEDKNNDSNNLAIVDSIDDLVLKCLKDICIFVQYFLTIYPANNQLISFSEVYNTVYEEYWGKS